MKNSSHPVQTYRKLMNSLLSDKESIEVTLAPNEFYDYNDPIGLFSTEPDPYNFLTVEDIIRK